MLKTCNIMSNIKHNTWSKLSCAYRLNFKSLFTPIMKYDHKYDLNGYV